MKRKKRSRNSRVTGYVVMDDETGKFFTYEQEGNWTEDRVQSFLFERWEDAKDVAKNWRARTIPEGSALCDRLELLATFGVILKQLDNRSGGYKQAVEMALHLQHTNLLRALASSMYKSQRGEHGLGQVYLAEVAALAIIAMHTIDFEIEKKALAASKKTTRGTFSVRPKIKRKA